MIRPRKSCWVPTQRLRRENRERVLRHPPGLFRDYEDFFFFLHIDPVVRFWHAAGMVGGCVLFPLAAASEGAAAVALGAIGVVFFYGFGYLAHWVYDGSAARTDPRYFLRSTPAIVEINLLTLTGRFDRRLREFLERYPFARAAYQLEEIGWPAASTAQSEP